MTKYLGLLQLSSDEAARIVEHGVAERREFLELLAREAGGSIEHLWLTDTGDWDIVCVVEMTGDVGRSGVGGPARGAAATLARRAAKLTRQERWISLAEPGDVADAMDALRGGSITGGG